jgi:hypothetical protein
LIDARSSKRSTRFVESMEAEMKLQSSKESSSYRGALAMFAALAFAAFACAPSVPLQNRPCPCGDGWVCCPSGEVCVQEGESCPGAAGTAGADGASSSSTAGVSGDTSGGTAGVAMLSDAGLPTLPNPTYTVQSTLLGTWSGYFENFTFPSKSDNLLLSLSQNADGSGKISVVLGMGPPPAPPTSAAATWPPTTDPSSVMDLTELAGSYIEGFTYDAYDVQWDGGRLRFVINDDEPWQPYCQLQTSYYVTENMPAGYQCIPGNGSGSGNSDGSTTCYAANGQPKPPVVSCMQAFACDMLCACDAAGCGAQVSRTTSFDITFTGTKGQGNVAIDTGHDVMLTQVGTPDGGQP